MNTENSRTKQPQRFRLTLADKRNLKYGIGYTLKNLLHMEKY